MNNNIYYCTVSQTRGLSAEMPIGDPLGGPAYGKREMPIAVLALAFGSFAAGAAMAAAATTLTAMVIGGALLAGGALTIIGTVTKSEKMTKIGGLLSLAGGVAAMAEGAFGAAAGEANAADGAVQLSGPGAEVPPDVSGNVASAADGAVQVGGPGTNGIADTAVNAGGPSVTDTSMPINDAAAQNAAGDATAAVDPAASPFTATSNDAMSTQAPSTDSAFQVPGPNDISGTTATPPSDATNVTTDGYFDKFGKFVKNNKELTDVGIKTIAGLIPTNESESKTELNRAQAERIRQMAEDERRRSAWRRGLLNY